MKWHITRKRLLAIIVVLFMAALAMGIWGCTPREEQVAKETAGAVSRAAGLPPFVGEALAGVAIAVITFLKGQQRGRNRERACHVPRPTPPRPTPPRPTPPLPAPDKA